MLMFRNLICAIRQFIHIYLLVHAGVHADGSATGFTVW